MKINGSKFKVLEGYVLVKTDIPVKDRKIKTSKSGIITTVQASIIDDRPTTGIIVQGPKHMINKRGYFEKHKGQDLKGDDGFWYLIIDEEGILGISEIGDDNEN